MSTKEGEERKKHFNSNNKSSSREEKRLQRLEKLRQYGVDLPDIPGLPVEVIPLHVHAMKMTAKLFGKNGPHQTKAFYFKDDDDVIINRAATIDAQPTQDASLLLKNIMQRVEDATNMDNDQPIPTEEQRRMENEILHKYQDGIHTWLNAIHRCVKDHRSRQTTEDAVVSAYSVPVAALQHLWNVGMDHKRFSVRRATQHLAGKLLEKSSDCRSWWLQIENDETSLRNEQAGKGHLKVSVIVWMDQVLQSSHSESGDAQELWQLEAFDLLNHLERKGYGTLYPTLISAIQRFQQKCPVSVLSFENNLEEQRASREIKSMAKFRFVRDTAMAHWDEMDTRVQKLIRKAKKCFDVLVPRIEDTLLSKVSENEAEEIENDDEEEAIDWEDGCDDFCTEDNGAVDEQAHHADAVERTLEIMKSTGGMQEGRIEISIFSNDERNRDPSMSNTNAELRPHHTKSKEGLDRVIKVLAIKYMSRISDWAQALAVADNLKVKRSGKKTSEADQNTDPLIQMTESEQIRRNEVLQSCLEVKQKVAHILQSAKRLGMDLQEARVSSVQDAPVPASTVPPAALRNPSYSTRFAGRKHGLKSRSTPLQIKFAKR